LAGLVVAGLLIWSAGGERRRVGNASCWTRWLAKSKRMWTASRFRAR